jgi:hypothetical protein
MALGSTKRLTEMRTRNIPGGKGRLARKADLTAICEPITRSMWEPRRLTTLWASTACYRDIFTLLYLLFDPEYGSDVSPKRHNLDFTASRWFLT